MFIYLSRYFSFCRGIGLLVSALSCSYLQADFTPIDESQCIYWTQTEQYKQFRAAGEKIDKTHSGSYTECARRWKGRSNADWLGCQNASDQTYLVQMDRLHKQESLAKLAYESERRQCVNIARQNKESIKKSQEQEKAQAEANRKTEQQQAELRRRTFDAEMAKGMAERDAYNRAAEERNRKLEQKWQAEQIRAQQAAAAEAEQRRRLEAERAERIRHIEEQQQNISNAQVQLLEYSNSNAERKLSSLQARTAEIASVVRNEDSEISRILAQAKAEVRQIKNAASDIYDTATLKKIDANSNSDDSAGIQYRRSRDLSTPVFARGDEGGAAAPECLNKHLMLDRISIPDTAPEVMRLETLMYLSQEHMKLAKNYPSCAGTHESTEYWSKQLNSYTKQCRTANANRACTATRHNF